MGSAFDSEQSVGSAIDELNFSLLIQKNPHEQPLTVHPRSSGCGHETAMPANCEMSFGFPRVEVFDDLGFEQPNDGFGQCVVAAVSDAFDGHVDSGLGEPIAFRKPQGSSILDGAHQLGSKEAHEILAGNHRILLGLAFCFFPRWTAGSMSAMNSSAIFSNCFRLADSPTSAGAQVLIHLDLARRSASMGQWCPKKPPAALGP